MCIIYEIIYQLGRTEVRYRRQSNGNFTRRSLCDHEKQTENVHGNYSIFTILNLINFRSFMNSSPAIKSFNSFPHRMHFTNKPVLTCTIVY